MGFAAGRRRWVACAALAAAAACTVTAPRLVGQVDRPTPPPTAAPAPPAPAPRASLLAAFKRAPPVPPAAPFDVVIGVIAIASLDNAALFGVAPPPVDATVARDAVHGAEVVLEAYLTGAFADGATRFTAAAANATLSGPAFARADAATLRALGARPAPAVEGVITGAATADAVVLVGPAGPASVSLTATARFELVAGPLRGPAVQYGVFTFAPRDGGGWVVVTADVVLDLPALVDAPAPQAPALPPPAVDPDAAALPPPVDPAAPPPPE